MVQSVSEFYHRVDPLITRWMARQGITLIRISLGVVFFWFGFLKFFPGMSPAQDLASRTIELLTFGQVPARVSIYLLAAWESAIGIGLLFGIFMRATLALLFVQMLRPVPPL